MTASKRSSRPSWDIGFLRDTVTSKEAWGSTPLHRQRELLGLAILAVFVYPSEPGRAKRYVDDRMEIAWSARIWRKFGSVGRRI